MNRHFVFFLTSLSLCLTIFSKPTPLVPNQVVVVYNSTLPESKALAEFYALNRLIPTSNLIGLEVPEKTTIDRLTYEKAIRQPLVKKFMENQWWELSKDQNGTSVPFKTKIRCIALIKGIPLRISREAVPKDEESSTRQFKKQNEASIDSELSLMGVSNHPIGGVIPNPCYNKEISAATNPSEFMVMVGRIDANTYDHCNRMILDALDVEKEGLWGMTYLDLWTRGGSYKLGDDWIENITKASINSATPTIVDRMKNTFVTNYPMRDAAVYFGWYTQHRNGPFLNDQMKFKKGAIAAHLHSFSGAQLLNPAKNWSVGLIDRGAAATLGNVWEPYLGFTHRFDIFYDRLLKKYSLVEAAYMSINVLSWQNIVIGDPLYRPFKTTTVRTNAMVNDRDYKLIRYAQSRFPDPKIRLAELLKAAERTKSGTVYEMVAFHTLEGGNSEQAAKGFRRAKELFTDSADKLRQDLHLVELERRRDKITDAIKILKQAKKAYKDIPEVTAVEGLLTILDPPSPPLTKPKN
nr:TIGR03790 family protein [bacterium]